MYNLTISSLLQAYRVEKQIPVIADVKLRNIATRYTFIVGLAVKTGLLHQRFCIGCHIHPRNAPPGALSG